MLSRFARKAVFGEQAFRVLYARASQTSVEPIYKDVPDHITPDLDPNFYPVTIEIEEKQASTNDPSKIVASSVSDSVPQKFPWDDSPVRDVVNFPKRAQLEKPARTRLGFIPDECFQFFYRKTGVTGPYCLGTGLILFCISKEIIFLHDVEFKHVGALMMWVYVMVKTPLGQTIADFLNVHRKDFLNQTETFRRENEQLRLKAIEHEKKEQWRLEGKQILFAAKRENVGLQQEAAYRQSALDLYLKVKRRLDYQVEVTKIDARIKQRFLAKWVIDQVNQAIPLISEKQNLKQCIANLNVLAAKA